MVHPMFVYNQSTGTITTNYTNAGSSNDHYGSLTFLKGLEIEVENKKINKTLKRNYLCLIEGSYLSAEMVGQYFADLSHNLSFFSESDDGQGFSNFSVLHFFKLLNSGFCQLGLNLKEMMGVMHLFVQEEGVCRIFKIEGLTVQELNPSLNILKIPLPESLDDFTAERARELSTIVKEIKTQDELLNYIKETNPTMEFGSKFETIEVFK